MDRRAREIIGLPVITMNRGNKIYDVEDLIMDPERSQVLALVVQEAAAFHSARAIPFGRINVIGQDAVVVPDGRAVIDVNRDQVLKRLHNKQVVRGLRVLTDDGRKLGTVSDMLVDSKTGEVKGYYVSLGRGLTVGQGDRWLPADQITSIGQRVIFVPGAVADDFEKQLGGIAGALEGAGNRMRTAGARFNSQLEQVGGQVRQSVPERATGYLVGRAAHEAVKDKEGNTIILPGDVITQESVDRAKEAGRLPQLFLSAGIGPVRQGAGSLQEEARYSFGSIPGEARDLWGRITGNYSRTVDQADERAMQRRIKNALGRPVTRVILDGNDNIILNTGDIVTNRAVEAARQAGVLDILVDSIYTDRPKLSTDDLKAPRSGDASLTNQSASPLPPATPVQSAAPVQAAEPAQPAGPVSAGEKVASSTAIDTPPAAETVQIPMADVTTDTAELPDLPGSTRRGSR